MKEQAVDDEEDYSRNKGERHLKQHRDEYHRVPMVAYSDQTCERAFRFCVCFCTCFWFWVFVCVPAPWLCMVCMLCKCLCSCSLAVYVVYMFVQPIILAVYVV